MKYILAIFILSLSSGARASQYCRMLFGGQILTADQKLAQQVSQKMWAPDQFTNPNFHDPNRFTYLVHTIPERYDLVAAAGFITDPLLSDYRILSTSVISEKTQNITNWAAVGFILEAPKENIIAATPFDMLIQNRWKPGEVTRVSGTNPLGARSREGAGMAAGKYRMDEYADALYAHNMLPPPSQILKTEFYASGQAANNEVAVFVQNPKSGSTLRIKAVFYLDGNLTAAQEAAKKLGVPAIPIHKIYESN